jgi:CelD/BcsL family acetyltransferase involved in cellulose biosynthesis
MRSAGFHPHQQIWARVALIDLAGTWEAYWRSRPNKWRYNVSRCRRRLSELGKVTHIRYRPEGQASGDGDPRWDLYDASVRLAQRSWQGSSTTGTTLCHGSARPFLRDAHAVAAAMGNLDLNLLTLDERPVAFSYNYHHRGWISGLRMGFDPQFAACGPGTVLLAMIVEDSFRRGDHTYDLGVGSLQCKHRWQTAVVDSHRYTHFPPADPRANLLRAKRWLQNRLYGPQYVQYEVKP